MKHTTPRGSEKAKLREAGATKPNVTPKPELSIESDSDETDLLSVERVQKVADDDSSVSGGEECEILEVMGRDYTTDSETDTASVASSELSFLAEGVVNQMLGEEGKPRKQQLSAQDVVTGKTREEGATRRDSKSVRFVLKADPRPTSGEESETEPRTSEALPPQKEPQHKVYMSVACTMLLCQCISIYGYIYRL